MLPHNSYFSASRFTVYSPPMIALNDSQLLWWIKGDDQRLLLSSLVTSLTLLHHTCSRSPCIMITPHYFELTSYPLHLSLYLSATLQQKSPDKSPLLPAPEVLWSTYSDEQTNILHLIAFRLRRINSTTHDNHLYIPMSYPNDLATNQYIKWTHAMTRYLRLFSKSLSIFLLKASHHRQIKFYSIE